MTPAARTISRKALLGLAAALALLVVAAPAQAASGTWDRTWGKNVDSTGGSGFGEICLVAAGCQAGGILTALGGELRNPNSVATDAAGNVYVADSSNRRIQKFDSAGNFQRAWGKNVNGGGVFGICTVAASCQAGTPGALGGEFNAPVGVATDSAGNVYVAEDTNNRIQKFDSAGNFQLAWGKNVNGGGIFGVCLAAASCLAGTTGGFAGELNGPTALTTTAGNVYVADYANNRVQRFDSAGNFQLGWGKNVNSTGGSGFGESCNSVANCQAGSIGGQGGEFNGAFAVATDAGSVYVADAGNNRIQKFDSAANFQLAWGRDVNGGGVFGICTVAASCLAGTDGGLGGEFSDPEGVATDSAGSVYVGDRVNNRIQKFDSAGNFQLAWGKNVNGGGVFGICTVAASCLAGSTGGFGGELNAPKGVAVDSAGNVYVADDANHRIQKFADPVASPPVATPAVTLPVPVTTPPGTTPAKKCKKGQKLKKGKCVKKRKKK